MKVKKLLIAILLFAACTPEFTACNNQGENDTVNESEIAEFIANYDRSNPFVDNQIIVIFTEEASYKNIFHDYTTEDFSGIGAVDVEELDGRTTVSNGLTYRIRQCLSEDSSGNTIPQHLKRYKRFFCITLDKNDEDNVLRAVYVLRQRSDIYSAGPNVTESPTTVGYDEIKTAYSEKYNVPVSEVFYTSYGEYNGAHALMIGSTGMGAGDAITYDTIGPATFTYSSTHKMDVYYDGDFYSLTTAYNSGWFTNDNVRSIADKCGLGAKYLTAEEEAEIIAAYRQSLEEGVADGAEIEISAYYAVAGEYKAVSVGVKGTAPYKDKTETITVDGELFGKEHHGIDKVRYFNSYGIQLYKDNTVYSLKYAVENKLISLDDYMEISSVNGFAWIS